MSRPTAKVSPKSLEEDEQDPVKKGRSPVDRPLRIQYWQSETRLGADICLIIFLLRTDSKDLGRQEIKAIERLLEGLDRSRFFTDRLNVIKLPARRIGRSRETQMKEFDKAGSELGSIVFENNRRDSIWTISLLRIKARESLENVIIKNFNFRDEVVRG